MRYLKTYEEFKFKEEEDTDVLEPEVELSDKTIDDVLSDDFLKDVEEEDKDSYIDKIRKLIKFLKKTNV